MSDQPKKNCICIGVPNRFFQNQAQIREAVAMCNDLTFMWGGFLQRTKTRKMYLHADNPVAFFQFGLNMARYLQDPEQDGTIVYYL